VINPLVILGIYTFVFSGILRIRFRDEGGLLNFAIYAFCGIVAWTAFSDAVGRSSTTINENVNLVKRVVFPLETLPVYIAISGLFTQVIGTIILVVIVLVTRFQLHWTLVFLPLLMLLQLMLTIGLSWFVSSLGVFIKDISHIVGLVLLALMFLTPIMYPESMVPERFRFILLNPMATLVSSYRLVIIEGQQPDFVRLTILSFFIIAIFCAGYEFFGRAKTAFSDVI
jgi:lipopolysaccharide transport system permease protein